MAHAVESALAVSATRLRERYSSVDEGEEETEGDLRAGDGDLREGDALREEGADNGKDKGKAKDTGACLMGLVDLRLGEDGALRLRTGVRTLRTGDGIVWCIGNAKGGRFYIVTLRGHFQDTNDDTPLETEQEKQRAKPGTQ